VKKPKTKAITAFRVSA